MPVCESRGTVLSHKGVSAKSLQNIYELEVLREDLFLPGALPQRILNNPCDYSVGDGLALHRSQPLHLPQKTCQQD